MKTLLLTDASYTDWVEDAFGDPLRSQEQPKALGESGVYSEVEMTEMQVLPLTDRDLELLALMEKDDHFYGAWRGGSKSAGGGPASNDTMRENTHPVLDKDGNPVLDKKGKPVREWNDDRVAAVHEPYIKASGEGLPVVDEPTVYMTGGGTAVGKSSSLLENPATGIPPKGKAAHVDPDSAKSAIPEFNRQRGRGDRTAAAYAHEESSHMSKAAVAANLRAGHNVVFDTTGDSGGGKMAEKIATMRASGAKRVEGHYASCDVKEAIRRSDARALAPGPDHGRYVAHSTIRQLHRDVTRTSLESMSMGLFDKMTFFDTNGKKPVQMATYEKGKGLKVIDANAWRAYTAKGQYKPGEMPTIQMSESAYETVVVSGSSITVSDQTNSYTVLNLSEAPASEEEAFTGWDVDSDELAQLMTDIGMGRSVADSEIEYTAAMKDARKVIEAEWEAYSKDHPEAYLDIPSELPRTDIDISDAPDPWAKPKKGKAVKESALSAITVTPLTEIDRDNLLAMEFSAEDFEAIEDEDFEVEEDYADDEEVREAAPVAGASTPGTANAASGPKYVFGRLNKSYRKGATDEDVKGEMGAIKTRAQKKGLKGGDAAVRATYMRNLEKRIKAGIIARATKKFGKAPSAAAVQATYNKYAKPWVAKNAAAMGGAAKAAPKATPKVKEAITVLPLTDLDRERLALIEKSGDSHFYGSWKGGSKSAGGGPADQKDRLPGAKDGDIVDVRGKDGERYLGAYRGVEDGSHVIESLNNGKINAYRVPVEGAKMIAKPKDRLTQSLPPNIAYEFNARGKTIGEIPTYVQVRTMNPLPGKKSVWPSERPILSYLGLGVHEPTGRLYREADDFTLTDLDRERLVLLEKGSGDHFYGSWGGGKAKAGGGPAGESADGNMKLQAVTGTEARHDLGKRPVSEINDAMENSLGKQVEVRYYDGSAITKVGNDEPIMQGKIKGTVTRVDAPDRMKGESRFRTQIDVGDNKSVILNADHVASFKPTAASKAKDRRLAIKAQNAADKAQLDRGVAEYKAAVAAKRDTWVPGGGGKETPFTRNGTRYQYVFNPGTGQHGILDMGRDIVINDKEFYREAAVEPLPISDEERELLDVLVTNPEDFDPGDLTEAERAAVGLAEKSGDSHFYGSWKGGGKSAGGGPSGEPVIESPKGEPGSKEREAAVDSALKIMPSSHNGPQGAHLEVRKTNGDLVTGRLESRVPGEITIRQYSDKHKTYASIPVATKDVSNVRRGDKPWVKTDKGWVRVGSPAAAGLEKKARAELAASMPEGMRAKIMAMPYDSRSRVARKVPQTIDQRRLPAYLRAPKGGLPSKNTKPPRAPQMPKGQSVLERPQAKTGFGPAGGGYNKSGTPKLPGGSAYGRPNPNKGWKPTWGGGGS